VIILLLGLLVSVLFHSQTTAEARALSLPIIDRIVEQIEVRRGIWIAYQADLTVHFFTEDNKSASCQGELTYHRLDEKILLSCSNVNDELLFIFKTDDRLFDLYIPAQNTAFHGNIFDLEDLPEIESHLNPLDLYRALKPMVLPSRQVYVESWNKKEVHLKVFGNKDHRAYLSRRLKANFEGDILWETYYSFDEKPQVMIERSDYQNRHPTDEGDEQEIVYPHQITIESQTKSRKTVLIFNQVKFLSFVEEAMWNFSIPDDTEILSAEMLKEEQMKDPQTFSSEVAVEIQGIPDKAIEPVSSTTEPVLAE